MPVPAVEGVATSLFTAGAQFASSNQGALVYVPGENAVEYTIEWMDRAGEREPLRDGPDGYGNPRFSPDGLRLAVDVAGEAGGLREHTLRANQPESSPDGGWLAYTSRESGRFEVYVRSFPGPGGVSQVSSEEGSLPAWSRTHRELFYRAPHGRIMVAPYTVAGGEFVAEKPRIWSEGRLARGQARSRPLRPAPRRGALRGDSESSGSRDGAEQSRLHSAFLRLPASDCSAAALTKREGLLPRASPPRRNLRAAFGFDPPRDPRCLRSRAGPRRGFRE